MSFFPKLKAWFSSFGKTRTSDFEIGTEPVEPKPQPASILDLFIDQMEKAESSQQSKKRDHGPVDVVICVHNALDDVKKCLDSIIKQTDYNYRIVLVNDGSDSATTQFLRRFYKQNQNCDLLENKHPLRYTYAANQGMRHSVAPIVVMLNSDTIVPANWLTLLIETLFSDPKIGMASPLSNAASWQSVPMIFDDSGDWAVNQIPKGYDLESYAKLIYRLSEKQFPKVDFLNGFCLAIKRDVITSIGYFDEIAFPKGFGEENDYSLRAREAGFELAIADHAFVYHSKSRSYQHAQRQKMSLNSSIALIKKHGAARVKKGLETIKHHPTLVQMRMRLKKVLGTRRKG